MKPKSHKRRTVWASCVLTALLVNIGIPSARAFTADDRWTAFIEYQNTFFVLVTPGSRAYYKRSIDNPARDGFWTTAEEIETVIDSYSRTGTPGMVTRMNELLQGFTFYNGTSWAGNTFNDDIMWACLAYVRAYTQIGTVSYRTTAKNNFDMAYARAWDTALGGGLWWTTAKGSKNSCVNGPGAIAAYRLYQATGDTAYLTKAQNILNWQKATLYNANNGQVFDAIGAGGVVNQGPTSYNQGTFLGACFYLGDSANATKAGNYTKNTWGINMQGWDPNVDGAGFNGICLRWMWIAGYDQAWRQSVANNAWSRRRTDGLTWNRWGMQTPTGNLFSWSCSGIVSAMMNVPPD